MTDPRLPDSGAPAPLRFAPIAKQLKNDLFSPRIVEGRGEDDDPVRFIAPINRRYANPKDALEDAFEVVGEFERLGYERGRAAGVEETRREVLQLRADLASVKGAAWKEGHEDGYRKGHKIGADRGSLQASLICAATLAILLGLIYWSGTVQVVLPS